MVAPTVYRWDDGNAPVARGERRSLVDILRACLVDGYGAKAAAGWTLEYINATFDKAAFRNNPVTGTGFYLQVDGFGAANAYTPKVQAFEAMTSESNGLFPFAPTVLTSLTSNAASATAHPWILIADDRAFYLLIWNSITATPTKANAVTTGIFFGDFQRYNQNDTYNCGLACHEYGAFGSLAGPATYLGLLQYGGINLARAVSGAAGGVLRAYIQGGGPHGGTFVGSDGASYAAGGPIFVTQPYIAGDAAYTIRGFMPGYYYPCHKASTAEFTQLQNVTADGRSFLALYHYVAGGNAGLSFLSLDDWRA